MTVTAGADITSQGQVIAIARVSPEVFVSPWLIPAERWISMEPF